jgi:Trk-type K+ transport system membrane component
VIGTLALLVSWWHEPFDSVRQQVFTSVFHSVSAFCNAGFSTFSLNLAERGSAMNLGVNMTITSLIIVGGIGFLVTSNILGLRFGGTHYRIRNQLSVHTKMVLLATAVLIVAGTGLILLLDFMNPGTLQSLTFPEKLLASYFQSVSTRTAGFNTIDISQLSVGSSLIMILWMFIGASPGSTGGGIKTTTATVIVLSVWHMIRGKSKIEFASRHIASSTVERAYVTLSLALLTLCLAVFFLALIEPVPLIDVLFECASALGTVGLSRGITMHLADASKLILTVTMLIGRVGTLTILVALIKKSPQADYDYPTEQILIG